MQKKLAIGVVEAFAFGALPLFLGAGTLAWPAGWLFTFLLLVSSAAICALLQHYDPALLEERLKGLYQQGQPWWDKIFLTFVCILWVAWLVLIGLDARRYHWSHVPFPVQILGVVAVIASWVGIYFVMRANSFLAPVVRLQTERGHSVISTGPYRLIRHPMYAAALLLFLGMPLMLGSWWGLLGAATLAAAMVLRVVLEERVLRNGLPGYADYAQRVRYRLVPLVW